MDTLGRRKKCVRDGQCLGRVHINISKTTARFAQKQPNIAPAPEVGSEIAFRQTKILPILYTRALLAPRNR